MGRKEEDQALLQSHCLQHGIPLEPEMLDKLVRYCGLLEQWNMKVNLISRKEDAPVIVKHIFHSLLISRYHPFRDTEKVLDLGTGGGLPGIPLSILFPAAQFLLVDATGKKIAACNAMITELGLHNTIALHSRVEELKGMSFDTVLSRQVAPLDELCGYACRLLKPGGSLICLKGGNLRSEVSRALALQEEHCGFPENIELYPISSFSPYFEEKKIVIALG
ncbi:MAG: 16S rRNA (guanine(527)-N(7))-methyltransferase RsmG [Chlorobiaceae bacterium]|nr:16S rRNA (guanine(527)-N(7))-methyltransferase RsmG [Chlorobiaceae bacterium]NTV60116.1 16S rRNA (guanine(527)-N(7))-methyltransferase RsmG [Chlorobiaceae bacterium]